MRIGYACLTLGLPGSELKSCRLSNASEDNVLSLIGNNLKSLENIIDYNARCGIRLFRISSDIIPFGSSLANNFNWEHIYEQTLSSISHKIKSSGMRVSMHPGQYTVLNSPNLSVAQKASEDLNYHAKLLSALELGPEHKLILHLGGKHDNKEDSIKRFVSRYRELNDNVISRLVLENDDRIFNIEDVLEAAGYDGIPVVYDNLHNAVNPSDKLCEDAIWIKKCSETWKNIQCPQKIHYSQQHPDKRPGAHSDFIEIDKFLEFCQHLPESDIDIMLEVKDKNLSTLKCINCTTNMGISNLETEWSHYKYLILERSPTHYNSIKELLKDENSYPAHAMYQMIETALRTPISKGNSVNAAQHVWGYFKDKASQSEKKCFERYLLNLKSGQIEVASIKNLLLRMARKYKEDQLLYSYYFLI